MELAVMSCLVYHQTNCMLMARNIPEMLFQVLALLGDQLEILLLQKGEREIERIVNHKAVVAFLPERHGSPCWHHIPHNIKRNTEKSSSEIILCPGKAFQAIMIY
ncbi:hypothetical protein NC652_040858 [Populus alba x Populus x berolinensis]|nr:hypothetical protein NC652_040858 [Populus alba x Populus x berolinensis]